MGFLKPDIESRQPKSQATPMAENFLGFLQQVFGEASGVGRPGEGGTGSFALTPQQGAAGESLQDYISARETPEMFEELMGPLTKQFGRETDRQAAQLQESMGAMGNRFSSSLQRSEGRFRREQQTDLEALMSKLFLDEQSNLLGAIGQQQAFGLSNLQPFMDFAGLGILPEQTIVSDNPYMDLLKIGGNIAAGAASGG